MADLVLPETSLWVRYLRRRADPELIRTVSQWLTEARVVTTELVKVELLQGAKTEAEFDRLKETLDALPLVTPDAATWEAAARNAFRLRRLGINVPTIDVLIASVARQVDAVLAHFDGHYEMIAPHLGLRTVSFLPKETDDET